MFRYSWNCVVMFLATLNSSFDGMFDKAGFGRPACNLFDN